MNKTENNLTQRFVQAYELISSVVKDGEIEVRQGRSYKVVTHDAVTRAIHPVLAKVGIVVVPTQKSVTVSEREIVNVWNGQEKKSIVYTANVEAEIQFINADKPDERLAITSWAYAFDSGDKAIGKAYSMAVKNAYLKMFVLESSDDEEEREPLVDSAAVARKPLAERVQTKPAEVVQQVKNETKVKYNNAAPSSIAPSQMKAILDFCAKNKLDVNVFTVRELKLYSQIEANALWDTLNGHVKTVKGSES